MPIYGYRCSSCGHQFEVQQRMSDEPLKVCPECQGKLTKILYPAGVIFKGSGFYTTDYKGSSNGSGSGSETKTETKTDSKPASESKSGSTD
ncbi:MAG TPA: zinc ribbon domain-containing protein [Candidatus Dormibacteraeota bacterium]|nr:zinc ribbon domain-containing protein [Candidatus Dormibacteraeota bacterium]